MSDDINVEHLWHDNLRNYDDLITKLRRIVKIIDDFIRLYTSKIQNQDIKSRFIKFNQALKKIDTKAVNNNIYKIIENSLNISNETHILKLFQDQLEDCEKRRKELIREIFDMSDLRPKLVQLQRKDLNHSRLLPEYKKAFGKFCQDVQKLDVKNNEFFKQKFNCFIDILKVEYEQEIQLGDSCLKQCSTNTGITEAENLDCTEYINQLKNSRQDFDNFKKQAFDLFTQIDLEQIYEGESLEDSHIKMRNYLKDKHHKELDTTIFFEDNENDQTRDKHVFIFLSKEISSVYQCANGTVQQTEFINAYINNQSFGNQEEIENLRFQFSVKQNLDVPIRVISLEEGVTFIDFEEQKKYLSLKEPEQIGQFLSSFKVLNLEFKMTTDLFDLFRSNYNETINLIQYQPPYKLKSDWRISSITDKIFVEFTIEYSRVYNTLFDDIGIELTIFNNVNDGDQLISFDKLSTKLIQSVTDYQGTYKIFKWSLKPFPSKNFSFSISFDYAHDIETQKAKELISRIFNRVLVIFNRKDPFLIKITNANDCNVVVDKELSPAVLEQYFCIIEPVEQPDEQTVENPLEPNSPTEQNTIEETINKNNNETPNRSTLRSMTAEEIEEEERNFRELFRQREEEEKRATREIERLKSEAEENAKKIERLRKETVERAKELKRQETEINKTIDLNNKLKKQQEENALRLETERARKEEEEKRLENLRRMEQQSVEDKQKAKKQREEERKRKKKEKEEEERERIKQEELDRLIKAKEQEDLLNYEKAKEEAKRRQMRLEDSKAKKKEDQSNQNQITPQRASNFNKSQLSINSPAQYATNKIELKTPRKQSITALFQINILIEKLKREFKGIQANSRDKMLESRQLEFKKSLAIYPIRVHNNAYSKRTFFAFPSPASIKDGYYDFWRFVIDQGCQIIISLETENYFPPMGKFEGFALKVTKEKRIGEYVIRRKLNISFDDKSIGKDMTVYHYHYLNWSNYTLPDDLELEEFFKFLDENTKKPEYSEKNYKFFKNYLAFLNQLNSDYGLFMDKLRLIPPAAVISNDLGCGATMIGSLMMGESVQRNETNKLTTFLCAHNGLVNMREEQYLLLSSLLMVLKDVNGENANQKN